MEVIGIIAEYNPFHLGHLYHIKKIKEMYKDSLIICVMSSSFCERGEVSVLNKWDKTSICLNNGIDIVIELPFVFSSQSADIFAKGAMAILNKLKVSKIVFGSETNDIDLLYNIANLQVNNNEFDFLVKKYLDDGNNYPTSLSLALKHFNIRKIDTPNDLLGISYIKEIIKNNYDIEPISIKRTNDYHGKDINSNILSASLIRKLIKENKDIKEDKSNEETKEVDYDSLDTLGKLEYLSTKDKRINKIIDNYDKYPEILLEMLTRNSDMTSYMLDYPEKKGNVYKDNIGKVQKGKFPLLLQYDKNWGYGIYGDNVLAINGCGPTVLSMVVAGLTGKNDITPYTIAEYSSDHGYYQSEWGTSWSLMTEGIRNFGVVGTNIELSQENIFSELEKGHPIVCSMRPGDFTTIGHFILLTGIKDGKITVNDPNSKERSNKLWDYETLEYQIKSLWSFTTL